MTEHSAVISHRRFLQGVTGGAAVASARRGPPRRRPVEELLPGVPDAAKTLALGVTFVFASVLALVYFSLKYGEGAGGDGRRRAPLRGIVDSPFFTRVDGWSVLVELLFFIVGLVTLVAGANRAVGAAGDLALFYGLTPFFVGVTLISVGTSVPEMVTSVYGAAYGAGDLVVGNIVGSETAQITLAIAVVAFVSPFVAERRNVLVYGSAMLLAMIVMLLTLDDGVVGRSEGFLMMLAYVQFIYTLYSNEGGEEIAEEVIEPVSPPRVALAWLGGGLLAVVGGGQVMVSNGVALAASAGVPEYLLGLLTGLGTTMPEIVVAGIAAREGDTGISVGAILGSNITDPVFSLGVGALFFDVVVDDVTALRLSLAYMFVVSVVVLGLFYWREGIDRKAAVVCLLLYLPTFVLV